MPKIRVLIVEDSATARRLLVNIVGSDPELEVIGEARDGIEGVELTQKLRPDVVSMDIQMPRMDGLAATKEIMITLPTPIVIVTASANIRSVEASMAALRSGALTVLRKPSGPLSAQFEEAARQLVTTLKAMSQVKVVRHWRERSLSHAVAPAAARHTRKSGRIVAIATSTGGPAALHGLLSQLPSDFAAPIVVVQHISPGFTAGLASWLGSACTLQVKVAEHGERLSPGTMYIAPEDRHLGVSDRSTVALSGAPPIGGFRPSGTFLFESVAQAFGGSTVALVLTGMGEDGLEGLRAVRQRGGLVIAQDEKTSVVFGMPQAAISNGLADLVLPLEAMPQRLLELV